jgi:hypothetical protein
MKRLTIASIVAVFAVAFVATPSLAAISMSGQVASGVQQLEADSGANSNQSLGFNDPRANLQVYGDVASGVDAYVDILSGVSSSDSDAQLGSALTDNSGLAIHEAYITLDELTQAADIKFGQFAVDFGNQHTRRTTNADAQDNPLVGNSLVDPYAVQSGVEVSGSANRFAWSAAVTNGASAADFSDSEGYGFAAKVWGDFTPGLSGAVSYYTSTHDQGANSNATIFAGGSDVYQGAAPGQAVLGGNGEEVSAWQVDLGYDLSAHNVPASIDAWYGDAEESQTGTDAELSYYGALAQYDINPQAYVAARYEIAENDDANNNTASDRIQVGAGYNLNSNTLAKIEYVTQDNEGMAPVASGRDNEFSGFTGELSVSF